MSHDPDDSVTLHHGDHLNLTCTVALDPAVDIDVTVTGTLSGKGILNPIFDTVKHIIPSIVKAFHKNAKACRAGFHKKPTKQDGTHMTIRSQISIPTSIFPTTPTIIPYSLFWNGCVYLCVVNSRISLWGLWVGVCIEGSRE